MEPRPFVVSVFFVFASASAGSSVTFESACECRDNHGEHRWAVKNDPSTPPMDASAKWFALTGRVVAVKVEADGDLHIALQDATGNKPGIVVVEVPPGAQWCDIRTTVFGWTRTRFPLHIQSTRKLTMNEAPFITVVGKAFWDINHAPKDQSNRRKYMPGYAVWEIHPVMKLETL
jgi:hypothetical protein